MFIHHSEGYVVIDGLIINGVDWATLEPDYVLPVGAVGLVYVQGERYYIVYEGGMVMPMPTAEWSAGDIYLAKKDDYIAAMAG